MNEDESDARHVPPPLGGPDAHAADSEPLGDWLEVVAQGAAADSGAPADLLGEYLVVLAHAASTGRAPEPHELGAVRSIGRRAAEQGVDANRAVDLYLSAAWRLWQQIPAASTATRGSEQVAEAAGIVLRVVDDAVAALVEGHQDARRQLIRQEESPRRAFLDDLLRGDADVSRLVDRAEPFGLDLGRDHQVLLAAPASSARSLDRAAIVMERFVVDQIGDREVLVATKDDLLVMILPGSLQNVVTGSPIADAAAFLHPELSRRAPATAWQVAAGRSFTGAYGVARSYEEARETLLLARRLHLDEAIVPVRDLLAYRVLSRDQAALIDLVETLLAPLARARGGPDTLLHTLEAFFASGSVATEAARRLRLSVRTVTYRLDRVALLTGHDPREPTNRLALHMAVLGARLLDWPSPEPSRLPPI